MAKIPEHILNDIQDRCDIVEVISGYIPLRSSGRNFKACCPFHHEKTPSFIVSPDKQIYHCFGCNSGGNVFSFIKEYEKIDFIEAVKMLAEKAGVRLPEYRKQNKEEDSLVSTIYTINDITSAFYSNLLEKAHSSSPVKRYIEKRGIDEGVMKKFRISYADSSWRSLSDYLSNRGVKLEIASKAGLILKSKEGSYYDLFRDRLIFPIYDVKGRVLGFGARVLDDSLPKYINSPETAVYKKSQHLYGLNFAKPYIKEKGFAIIVEGYIDVVMSHQYGINNTLSSLGTALTLEQIRLLRRYTHNIVMVYDADQAGELAALRGLDLFLEEGMNVKVAILDQGHDPDSFIRKFGPRGFNTAIKKAKSLFTYKLDILNKKFDSGELELKAEIVKEMLSTILRVRNAVTKAEYIKNLSQELSIKEDAIWEEVKKIKKGRSAYEMRTTGHPSDLLGTGESRKINIPPAEKILLRLMLEDANVVDRVKANLLPVDFKSSETRYLVETLFNLNRTADFIDVTKLINFLEDTVSPNIISFIVNEEIVINNKEKNISDCIKTIKKERRDGKLKDIQNQIVIAQKNGHEDEAKSLLKEFSKLIKDEGNVKEVSE
ncbi:MAG: DNA primase [Candidatus Omnitrophica bacterium]|nr:DNA primase [Candidatus Omnitrophota bacterium]